MLGYILSYIYISIAYHNSFLSAKPNTGAVLNSSKTPNTMSWRLYEEMAYRNSSTLVYKRICRTGRCLQHKWTKIRRLLVKSR